MGRKVFVKVVECLRHLAKLRQHSLSSFQRRRRYIQHCWFSSHKRFLLSIEKDLILASFLNRIAEVPQVGSEGACYQHNKLSSEDYGQRERLTLPEASGRGKVTLYSTRALVAWFEEKWFLACSSMQVRHGRLNGLRSRTP